MKDGHGKPTQRKILRSIKCARKHDRRMEKLKHMFDNNLKKINNLKKATLFSELYNVYIQKIKGTKIYNF